MKLWTRITSPRKKFCLGFAAICLLLMTFKLNNSKSPKIDSQAELTRFFSRIEIPWSPLTSKLNNSKSPEVVRQAEVTLLPTFDLTSIDRNIRTSLSSNSMSHIEKTYFRMITQNHILCPHTVRIGGFKDGGWDVCLASPFNIQRNAGCIAFSFGINYIYDYDNVLATKYNCAVRMFDPSMTDVADGPIGPGRRQWFYKRGLAGRRITHVGFQLDKLCSIVDEFAGAGKTVDLLKIDIEKWEWESLETALSEGCLSRVKQLLVETHIALPKEEKTLNLTESAKPNYVKYLRVWSGLLQQGFRMWKWHVNPQSYMYSSAENKDVTIPCCFEHYMVNWNFVQLP